MLRAALVSLALILANAAAAQEMTAARRDVASLDWARATEDAGDLAALNAASGLRAARAVGAAGVSLPA